MKIGKNILLVPVAVPMLVDLAFTLFGQPASYWKDYALAREGSPQGLALLARHPLLFVLFFLVYFAASLFLVSRLKRPLNIVVGMSLMLGHAWGSASWIRLLASRAIGPENYANWTGYYATIAYFIILALVCAFCAGKWLKAKEADCKNDENTV